MTKPSHIISYKGYYYYFIRIPSDLKPHFPFTFFKKSLKTTDKSQAKEDAILLEKKTSKTFRMLRSGLLSEAQAATLVSDLMPKKKTTPMLGVKLSKVIDAYTKEHERQWGHKTKLENLGSYKLILDILGDMEVAAITKQTIVDLRGKFERLPGNMYKIYPGKTAKQVLAMLDITPMSTTSVNKHMFRLSSVLKFAVKEGHIQVNFAESMKIQQKRRADEERKAYTREDLNRIVKHLPREEDRPERYWIPLLGMYSGMRLDEICQMYLTDVQQLDDVWCFHINDDQDKKLKTLSSKRVIPIHPTLLHFGFLEYVDGLRRVASPRLWMNLNWREADGYSNAFGKWYQRFNREHVTTDKAKVFHSLRHTVADTMKQAGVQEVVIAEIMGHANDSMTMSRYGKRYQPKVLLEALVLLDYGIKIK